MLVRSQADTINASPLDMDRLGLDGLQSDVHLNTQHYSLNCKGIEILTFNRAAVILGVVFDCMTTPSKKHSTIINND